MKVSSSARKAGSIITVVVMTAVIVASASALLGLITLVRTVMNPTLW